ncbi:hypothetical protein ACIBEJ_46205 [Nonomuraea sp. NPDC050790]|uniref:hypothetical protein n=1 Tax=Nonomuraea sp. NPDC050790 TaxID=3364371 RepID=UPI003798E1FD
MREAEIVAAAWAVLPRLGGLLGDEGPAVGRRLQALLSAEVVDLGGLVELLGAREATRRAMRDELAGVRDALRDGPEYAALAGLAEPAAPILFRCPVCGFAYPVFEVGEPVPASCPEGHGPLVKAG